MSILPFLVIAFIAAFVQVLVSVMWLKRNGDGPESFGKLKASGFGRVLFWSRVVMVISCVGSGALYLLAKKA